MVFWLGDEDRLVPERDRGLVRRAARGRGRAPARRARGRTHGRRAGRRPVDGDPSRVRARPWPTSRRDGRVEVDPETTISADRLPAAVGQIVLTVTSAPGVRSVALVSDGGPCRCRCRAVPSPRAGHGRGLRRPRARPLPSPATSAAPTRERQGRDSSGPPCCPTGVQRVSSTIHWIGPELLAPKPHPSANASNVAAVDSSSPSAACGGGVTEQPPHLTSTRMRSRSSHRTVIVTPRGANRSPA